jgi:hypothetical protein
LCTAIVYVIVSPGLTLAPLGFEVFVTASDGWPTVSVACAGAPFVAPWPVVTAPGGIVFVSVPVTLAVTVATIVHVAFAAMLAPEREIVEPPAAADTEPPVHVVEAFGVAASVTFVGSGSVSASDESVAAFADVLATVIVRIDVAPGAMMLGAKAFVTVTPDAFPTLSVACAGAAFVDPCASPSELGGIVFT